METQRTGGLVRTDRSALTHSAGGRAAGACARSCTMEGMGWDREAVKWQTWHAVQAFGAGGVLAVSAAASAPWQGKPKSVCIDLFTEFKSYVIAIRSFCASLFVAITIAAYVGVVPCPNMLYAMASPIQPRSGSRTIMRANTKWRIGI